MENQPSNIDDLPPFIALSDMINSQELSLARWEYVKLFFFENLTHLSRLRVNVRQSQRRRYRHRFIHTSRARQLGLLLLCGDYSIGRSRCMIDLYYWTTPNGHKITIFLEETGLPYKIKPVNIGKGDQFAPEFLAISPNNRIPAIVDHEPADGKGPLDVFESGAILQYLPDKT